MKLVRHVTDLVKDVDKFKNSIALVATKVDNQYIKRGRQFILVEDNTIISAIADFLLEVQQDLSQRVEHPKTSPQEVKFYGNAVKFIDVLLSRADSEYTNIGIFRRPDEPGPLSNITLLQEGKRHIEKMLYETLAYTEKVDEDFGYTISEKSKNDIKDLVEEINENAWSYVSTVTGDVWEYYRTKTLSSQLRRGYAIVPEILETSKNLKSPKELLEKISRSIASLDIDIPDRNIANIQIQAGYFNFLQVVSDRELKTRSYEELFKGLTAYLFESKENIQGDVNDASKKSKTKYDRKSMELQTQ
ncbi:uncharacterized protein CEXT_422361 [Caerostris extrusa]|uniref:Uncharacterized protein n=1 Tax=Caerostris extrusa TaxID=172846 RepID=A0AAV4U2L8_CAEEX|nr:uncharacterized protein CEXT_422361 [Caerostris extrusa]